MTSSLLNSTDAVAYKATCNATLLKSSETELHKIARIIIMILFTTNIAGNLSVIIVMWGSGRKKRMRFFILNLAVTDLFIAIGGILPELILTITVQFYAPEIICRLVKYMSGTATYASSFALVVLSFDRAEAVINPLRSTKKTCFGAMRRRDLIICAWVAACIFGLPGLILAHLDSHPEYGRNCHMDFQLICPQAYMTSVAVTVFILPALFITICHVVMVVRIWQAAATTDQGLTVCISQPPQSKKVHRGLENVLPDDSLSQATDKNGSILHKTKAHSSTFIQLSTATGCIPRARVKTVKLTLVIVSVYIICWCPYMIYNLLVTYQVIGRHTPRLMAVSPLIQHLVTLNSSANPIIFWIFSAHTIITERRKNRRSKVVQRYHRRWKYNVKKRVWHDQSEQTEESMRLTKLQLEQQSTKKITSRPDEVVTAATSSRDLKEAEKTQISAEITPLPNNEADN